MSAIPRLIARARQLARRDVDRGGAVRALAAALSEIDPHDLSAGHGHDHGCGWQMEDLCTTPAFSLTLFTMARGSAIAFHDHPSMSVLMRGLRGRLRVSAYDWARRGPSGGLARHTYEVSMDAGADTLIVEPDHGNIHRIVAHEDGAFLDIAWPPYAEARGRRCQFYRVAGASFVAGERLIRLIPRRVPRPVR